MPPKPPDLKTKLSWVSEAMLAASEWREESWRDCAAYDAGLGTWTEDEYNEFRAANIDPLNIPRIFPVVNLLMGQRIIQKTDIIAKGRTTKDGESSQVMTEGIKFVMDQANGQFIMGDVFKDVLLPGFGSVMANYSNDPRRERVTITYKPWFEVWWDPFGPPWYEADKSRYVFSRRWMDVEELKARFPEKANQIEEQYNVLISDSVEESLDPYWDEGTQIEEERRLYAGSSWADRNRRRVRPCDMWYPVWDTGMFAKLPDGRVYDLDKIERNYWAQIVSQSYEVVKATVRRMSYCTFIGQLTLAEGASPFKHDEFPYVPCVGYVDRYGQPFGAARQLIDLNKEVSKRRSMALALMKAKRLLAEKDIVNPAGDKTALTQLWEEVQSLDGAVWLEPGSLSAGKIQIENQTPLAPAQVMLLEQSEKEIQQISGANAEMSGYESDAQSGIALKQKEYRGQVMTVNLFENFNRFQQKLGELLSNNIQSNWKYEKVLRITDRLTGAEKFVTLNERITDPMGQVIDVKNDLTQGKYDIIISEAPYNDTSREMYLQLIIEWVKKSPPEIIPQLILFSIEMSNLPNKDELLSRLKPLLKVDPREEDMSADQRKQKVLQELQAQQQQANQMARIQQADIKLELNKKALEAAKLEAQTREIYAGMMNDFNKLRIEGERLELDSAKVGIDTGFRAEDMKQGERQFQQGRLDQREMAAMQAKEKQSKGNGKAKEA